MNRRNFLKFFGAASLLPSMPLSAIASNPVSTGQFTAASYQWAETIARSQNRFNVSLITKTLGITESSAQAIRQRLIENGVINGFVDAAGYHRAAQPMYESMLSSHLKLATTPSNMLNAEPRNQVVEVQDDESATETQFEEANNELAPEENHEASLQEADENDLDHQIADGEDELTQETNKENENIKS